MAEVESSVTRQKDDGDRPLAIVLGGTFPHIALIRNLRDRGYYVVLVDYLAHPPARGAADEHVQESTLDREAVLDIAKKRHAELVISTCIDQANVTACYVAEKLGLSAPYDCETALAVTNKTRMKQTMVSFDIPTSKYVVVRDLSAVESSALKFPVAVKPADSNSSKGVRKACNRDELDQYLGAALQLSRNGEAIVEEYKEGREIGVDCFLQGRSAVVIMTRERRKAVYCGDPIQQIQGSFWPADISESQELAIQRIAEKIAEAFELSNTPLMMQTIIDGNDIHVIEFGARIGGGENYRIISMHTGFDIIDAAVNSFLGQPVSVEYQQPTHYLADVYLYVQPGPFGGVTGYQDLVDRGLIEYLNVYKAQGTHIGAELSSNNRVGAFLVRGQRRDELCEKIEAALAQLEVFDIDGRPILRRELYGR